jgi:ABC-type lipoprotein release transport system permease subunit
MKLPRLLSLSLKYLFRYRRRYLFLFFALSFSFGIVTLLTAIRDGMSGNVYNSAQAHYAGDIIAAGYNNETVLPHYLSAEDAKTVFEALDAANIAHPLHVVRRTIFGDRGVIYHNGIALRLKYVTGVNWKNEASYIEGLSFTEGPLALNDDTILLSVPAAEQLGARAGDRITLEVETRWGQKNTRTFIVGGIIDDSTIFGYYKVFVSLEILNGLTLLGEDECGIIGIYVADRNDVERQRLLLQGELEKRIPTGPIVHNREELEKARSVPFTGTKIFLLSIPVYLSEVADLLDAMNLIAYFLYIMMLVIIFVSALVTYRLVFHERRRELGTMRAIGFFGVDIRFVLLLETLALALFSLAVGMLLALLFQWAVTFIPLSWFPSFEIFLEDGKFSARYLPGTMAVNVLAVIVTLAVAAAEPLWRVSREALPALLNGGQ